MVLKSKAAIKMHGNSHVIYFPKELIKDSAFPFKITDELVIEIKGKEIVVRQKIKSDEL